MAAVRCRPEVLVLAYVALVYLVASVTYLVVTLSFVGTPFKDSLTPEQRAIKKQSSTQRMGVFLVSVLFAIAIVTAWRPLRG